MEYQFLSKNRIFELSVTLYSPLPELSNEAEFESLIPIVLTGIGGREKIEVTPYGIYGSTFDSLTTKQGDAGFDMKVPLGATGVANFAFNPDFSQLEGDPLQFDFYTQYAFYYPEYRPFFIEEKGVFQTDRPLYYSRTIQNPFLAGRYTYKDPQNQAGVIFAYDEEDTIIGNSEAVASILRYTRQYGKNNAGAMMLGRHNSTDDYNNLVMMTDGNFYLPFNVKLTYQLAGTGIDSSSEDIFSNVGFYYHAFLTYVTTNWIILGNFWGLSPDFANDLGYITQTDRNYSGGYVAKRFHFDNNVIKKIEIGENFGFWGTWSGFDDYIKSSRDSLEYFAITQIKLNLFTSTFFFLSSRIEKTFWEGEYLQRWAFHSYGQSRLNEYIFIDGSLDAGYMFDYNIVSVGRFLSGHCDISYSPFPVLSISGGVFFTLFDTDTTMRALKPSDVVNPVFTWGMFSPEIGFGYNPTNDLSFRIVAQRQTAHFASGYDDNEEYKMTDDRFFGVIEYKPSIGNVIYLGGRYPEKLLFFKFTHRFML